MSFLTKLLGTISGVSKVKVSEQLLFDKVIGFKSLLPGCGASTILQNVAVALAEKTSYNICILDTNFMFPMQYRFFVNNTDKKDDLLDYSNDLEKVVYNTGYHNLYVICIKDCNIVDMLSTKDNEAVIVKLIGALKSYFDIILIDLATNEPTHINTHAGIKCNKVFTVIDPSLRSMTHLKKAYNTLATLAVSFEKSKKIIINKNIDIVSGVDKTLEEIDLDVVGVIPLSYEIAKFGITGEPIWTTASRNPDILQFNAVIDAIVDNILQVTPLNEKYLKKEQDKGNVIDIKEDANAKDEKRKKKKEEKQSKGVEEIKKEVLQESAIDSSGGSSKEGKVDVDDEFNFEVVESLLQEDNEDSKSESIESSEDLEQDKEIVKETDNNMEEFSEEFKVDVVEYIKK